MKKEKIIVIGSGNFGTCLAQHLSLKGHDVTIWGRDASVANGINENHKNPKYLKDVTLSNRLKAISEIEEGMLNDYSVIVLATPTQFLRQTLKMFGTSIKKSTLMVSSVKGIETSTGQLPHGIVCDLYGDDVAHQMVALSGPSFAIEVAQKLPTAVTMASMVDERAAWGQKVFHTPYFRAYTSQDIDGLEIAGALKNVIAIAAGACKGYGFQSNSLAALITRGLAEMARVGERMGANPLTFKGLGGVGDLFLTCTSEKSRNYTVGYRLGKGEKIDDIIETLGSVAEGVQTTKSAFELAKKLDVETPITNEVYKVIYENKDIKDAVWDLISRDPTPEIRH